MTKLLIKLGYKQAMADPRMFSRWVGSEFIIMCIHVDDFLVTASVKLLMDKLYRQLSDAYGQVTVKDDDLLPYLGMQITSDDDSQTITISQPGFIRRLVDEFLEPGWDRRSAPKTPMSVIVAPRPGDDSSVDQTHYLRVVGSINYLAQYSRPDILFPMSIAASKCAAPTVGDLRMVHRIIQYLSNTIDYGLVFHTGAVQLVCYVDASHNCHKDDRGHYGYLFSLGRSDGSLYARSKKLPLIMRSSTESEYVALCEATREAVWIHRLLGDIGFPPTDPAIIMQDNQSTILMVKGHRNHQASKHVNPKYHYTGERQEAKDIELKYCPTSEMVANILTKLLHFSSHEKLMQALLGIIM